MRILIISDIHGNFDALAALQETYDELWVLGDLVNYGPDPAAVIDFVRSKAAVVVCGNHDYSIGFNQDPALLRSIPRNGRGDASLYELGIEFWAEAFPSPPSPLCGNGAQRDQVLHLSCSSFGSPLRLLPGRVSALAH